MEELRIMKTDEEMKVFSDPFRLQIISAYKKAEKPMTAKGIADVMGVVPSKVHYHVKKLLAVNILALDHIESINGIQAKFYRLTAKEFRLELSDSMGDTDLIANRTIQIFNAVLDEYKMTMLKTANTMTVDGFEPKGKGTFLSGVDIYMDDEEASEFQEAVNKLVSKYKIKKNEEQIAYKALISAVQDCNKK